MSLDIDLTETFVSKKIPEREYKVEHHSLNITHNLSKMASKLNISSLLWVDSGLEAKELIEPLEKAILELKINPEDYRIYEASNGWGTVEQFINFLEELVFACKAFPWADIEISV